MRARSFIIAGQNWDPFTGSIDPAVQSKIRSNVSLLGSYTTYFDTKLAWMPETMVYFDSYAIYVSAQAHSASRYSKLRRLKTSVDAPSNHHLVTSNPEWILKDAAGNNLFIPWGCSSGTCPQYAGDIANINFVNHQISQIVAAVEAGSPCYRGVFLDDVNIQLASAVCNNNGAAATPIDTNTGMAMTARAWQTYFVRYVETLRAALDPSRLIIHNAVWFNGYGGIIDRQLMASDYINIERGFGDSGITGGTGQFSLSALMKFVDHIHALGVNTVFQEYEMTKFLSLSLACFFLVTNNNDFIGANDMTPDKWVSGVYSLDLGAPKGLRYQQSQGLWRRDFYNGMTLVCEPGAPTATIQFAAKMKDYAGNTYTSVTLNQRQGIALVNA